MIPLFSQGEVAAYTCSSQMKVLGKVPALWQRLSEGPKPPFSKVLVITLASKTVKLQH